MPEPRLIPVREPDDASAAVLVLHGGAARRAQMMVSPAQLSVVRMIPIAQRIARLGDGRLAVYRLLNSVRGWDTGHTPVDDARWALDQVAERYAAHGSTLPVGLVGHSLGGRAALLSAGAPGVRCTVALAPWVYPTDRVDRNARNVLVVHGSRDRIARPDNSAAVARAAAGSVGYITIDGGKHAMLSHHAQYDGYAAAFTAAVLLPDGGIDVPEPVREVLAGQQWVQA